MGADPGAVAQHTRNGRIKELKQVDDKMNLQKNNWHSYKTKKYFNSCLQKFVTHIVLGPVGSKKNFLTKTSLQPQNISTKFQVITSKHRIHLLIQKKSLMFYHVQNSICFPVSPAPSEVHGTHNKNHVEQKGF